MANRRLHRQLEQVDKLDRKIETLKTRKTARVDALKRRVAREALKADLAAQGRAWEQRQERDSRLIKLGTLAHGAGLLDLGWDVLLGALRGAAPFRGDGYWTQLWRSEGRKILASSPKGQWGKTPEIAVRWTSKTDPKAPHRAFNHRRIVAGALLEKAGLGEWDEDVLVGVLAGIAKYRNDPKRIEKWKAAGKAPAPMVEKEVEVQFPDPIDPEISRQLREMGLKFDRQWLVWSGLADPAQARKVARRAGGKARVRSAGRGHSRQSRRRKMECAPPGGHRSGRCFDRRPGVFILELLGAQVTEG